MASRKISTYSFGSSDIVKQGYLYVKRPPGNRWNKIKAWHKRFFILRDSSTNNSAELAMYNSLQEAKTNSALLNLYLRETVHIGIASESHRFSNVLVVVFNGRSPLLLAAEDELTARSWMLALDLTSQKTNPSEGPLINWSSVNNSIAFPRCSSQASATTASGSVESDGSNCSCAPPFVKESPVINTSAISEETHINQSSSPFDDDDEFYNGELRIILQDALTA
ncbi:hypothetical protein B4U79_19010 [Dinothrombium tinctorium]|uniref:PH domain-containing protein n=1 Tax=Dinothrombium tinctorium TaxID=1965070 RepID=A0A443R394_9ACAR|nr:hypothetical protein B4U79_19011 [Dinothrombium tinctorium]RWS09761.1 hypothetical protein B4U79_19010 [Dinothrombium tinctorium]